MRKVYEQHNPSKEALERINYLRQAFSDMHDLIEASTPDCRERSIAFTNLEQAAMWAIKAVAHSSGDMHQK